MDFPGPAAVIALWGTVSLQGRPAWFSPSTDGWLAGILFGVMIKNPTVNVLEQICLWAHTYTRSWVLGQGRVRPG